MKHALGSWPLFLLMAGCVTPSTHWLRDEVDARLLDQARIWTRDSVHCDNCLRALPAGLVDSLDVGYSNTEDPATKGTEFTFGAGAGSGTIMCNACAHAGKLGGSTLTLQYLERVKPHLRVGTTVDAWCTNNDWVLGTLDVKAVAFYYPWTVRRGFFIGGGPDYSMIYAMVTDSTGLKRHGWGLAAEMGYDIRPRATVSLTPFVQYSYAWVGRIDYPLGSGVTWARDWKHHVVSVGLGVTLHQREQD